MPADTPTPREPDDLTRPDLERTPEPDLTSDLFTDRTPDPEPDLRPDLRSDPEPAGPAPESGAETYPADATTSSTPPVPPGPGPEPHAPVAPVAFAPTPTAVLTTDPVPAAPPATGVDEGRRDVRMRTVVFGLVLLVIAGSVLIGQLTDITVDAGGVILALMVGAGVLLIVGARRS